MSGHDAEVSPPSERRQSAAAMSTPRAGKAAGRLSLLGTDLSTEPRNGHRSRTASAQPTSHSRRSGAHSQSPSVYRVSLPSQSSRSYVRDVRTD